MEQKQEKSGKNGLIENPWKITDSPRVAQQKHKNQACDWKDVTSNDDNIYGSSKEQKQIRIEMKSGLSQHEADFVVKGS